MCNYEYAKPINEGASIEYAPTAFAPVLRAPTESEYNAHGYYRVDIQPSSPPDGKVMVSTQYVVEDNKLVAVYEYGDAPVVPKIYSAALIIEQLISLEKWNVERSWMKSEGWLDWFVASKEIKGTDTFYADFYDSLSSVCGLTAEQCQEVLSTSEL